jgi:hypothetical protein
VYTFSQLLDVAYLFLLVMFFYETYLDSFV